VERDEVARRQIGPDSDHVASSDDEALSLSSAGSFREAEFRLESITEALDTLYTLAARIRSPRNRPQRSTKDLYKHIPEKQREDFMKCQEHIEISRVAFVQRQNLLEYVDDEQLCELGCSRAQLDEQYAAPTHWLVRRTGIANARRKQQFVYWRKHAELLGRDMTQETAIPVALTAQERSVAQQQREVGRSVADKVAPAVSMATSATRLQSDLPGLDDQRSVISHQSRVSTAINPKGGNLTWPPTPSHLAQKSGQYFPCPYCTILCPARYLSQDGWR
jgi:hypothetical protein